MNAKATPGPWKVDGAMIVPETAVKSEMGYQSGEYIAQVYDTLRKTQKANARLIAAAPDLLAALITIRSMLAVWSLDPDKSPNTILSLCPMMDAAIAKTKGAPACGNTGFSP